MFFFYFYFVHSQLLTTQLFCERVDRIHTVKTTCQAIEAHTCVCVYVFILSMFFNLYDAVVAQKMLKHAEIMSLSKVIRDSTHIEFERTFTQLLEE